MCVCVGMCVDGAATYIHWLCICVCSGWCRCFLCAHVCVRVCARVRVCTCAYVYACVCAGHPHSFLPTCVDGCASHSDIITVGGCCSCRLLLLLPPPLIASRHANADSDRRTHARALSHSHTCARTQPRRARTRNRLPQPCMQRIGERERL